MNTAVFSSVATQLMTSDNVELAANASRSAGSSSSRSASRAIEQNTEKPSR